MEQDNGFTVLENKTIGKNISMYRKIRGIKATDMAERLGMKEAAYTRYERGDGAITIDLIHQVAGVLNIDPLMLVSLSPNNFLENCSHFALRDYYNNQVNEQQTQAMSKLIDNMVAVSEKLIALLDKGKKKK